MDKSKLIQSLTNIPEEWVKIAYTIDIWSSEEIRLQMHYDSKLAKKLINANKWEHETNANKWEHKIDNDTGFLEFRRDDGLKITMT